MLSSKEVLGSEEDFNLNKFRDSLYLRMSSPNPIQGNSVRKEEDSVRKSSKKSLQLDAQHRKSVPSFDELLKTMNSSSGFMQAQNSSNQKRNITDSSRKMSGLQNKIEGFGNGELNQLTRLSQPFISNKPIPLPTTTPQKRINFSSSISEKPVFAKENGKTLIDKVSLKELMEIRSRIDNSTQQEVQQLSLNYVQELVKLSQVITKQVRNVKY